MFALGHVMLDDRGAGTRGRIDDDARVGDVIGALAGCHMQDDQRQRYFSVDLDV
jgi:hypothetical protein